MNKKNILLPLALPLLLLSACDGETNEKESASSSESFPESSLVPSEESSSNESIAPGYSRYQVDENKWAASLGSVNSLTSISASEGEGGDSFVYTYLDEDAMRLVESFRKTDEDLAKQKAETFFSKSVDGSYERYTYDENTSSYMVETLAGESSYWKEVKALFSLLSSSFSSFDFLESNKGYFASSLVSNSGDVRLKNALIYFDDGAISSISFVLLDEDGETLNSTVIMNINCTYVSLPSKSQVNEGLVDAEGWNASFALMGADRNATLFYTDGLSSLDSSLKTVCQYVYDGNKAHTGISINSSSESEDPNISTIKTNIEKDIYYEVIGDKAYSYEKMASGEKYEKTLLSSSTLPPWNEYDALVSAFSSSFSSFTYDENSGSFKADSLPSNGNFSYENVEVKFSYGKLSSITYGGSSTTYKVSDIGSSEVTLPSEDKIYTSGKVSKDQWESILLEAATSPRSVGA